MSLLDKGRVLLISGWIHPRWRLNNYFSSLPSVLSSIFGECTRRGVIIITAIHMDMVMTTDIRIVMVTGIHTRMRRRLVKTLTLLLTCRKTIFSLMVIPMIILNPTMHSTGWLRYVHPIICIDKLTLNPDVSQVQYQFDPHGTQPILWIWSRLYCNARPVQRAS